MACQVGVGDTHGRRHNPNRFLPTPEEGLDDGVDEKFELAGEVAATVVTYGLDVRSAPALLACCAGLEA